jgi:2-oxo-4-hydroxy-4-carboxy-5-ureidoimidazoline decarboxylase
MFSIEQINAMEHAMFEARLGAVYEHSPWVAARAWPARPFASAEALHAAMQRVLAEASRAEQLALILAHPQLIGRLAAPGDLTAASRREQASAGLDRCSAEQLVQLRELNRAYVEKFGFPFIVAVRGLNTDAIIARIRERLLNGAEAEFRTSLDQIGRIARFRLGEMISGPNAE